jgi:UDP-glucose 4-epimerase
VGAGHRSLSRGHPGVGLDRGSWGPSGGGRRANNIYNISSGRGLSINQILDRFRRILHLNFKVKYLAARKFDVKSNILDNSLAAKYLKWKPDTEFNTALKNTWKYILDKE